MDPQEYRTGAYIVVLCAHDIPSMRSAFCWEVWTVRRHVRYVLSPKKITLSALMAADISPSGLIASRIDSSPTEAIGNCAPYSKPSISDTAASLFDHIRIANDTRRPSHRSNNDEGVRTNRMIVEASAAAALR